MSILTSIFGDSNAREIKKDRQVVEKINQFEEDLKKLSDRALAAKTDQFRSQLDGREDKLDDILPEAFAVVREASRRILKMRHFDVQLIGGLVLHQGKIAEMRTGEGKTLVATAPVYLNALPGKGVHVVTVNDYLARRDAGWMAQIYHFLGLSTGVIIHEQSLIYDPEYNDEAHSDERLRHFRPVTRQQAYQADITYGTNNEFGFDYLRDNMVQDTSQMVQRPLNYAIVDEVDSILIDEARTPLIISQPHSKSTDRYYAFAKIARSLKEERDYTVDEKQKAVSLTEDGIGAIEKALGVDNVYEAGMIEEVHHVEAALKAEAIFKRDRDYVVNPDGEIIIVDEFTGRLLPGRRYSEGLHQAIEAKEGVTIQQESQTLATITFQNLFRLYQKLAGMTGTAVTEAEEFAKIYKLEVTTIPTHQPMIRKDLKDRIYKTEEAKFAAVVAEVAHRHQVGQPVLIGTVSIEKNEILGKMLTKAKVPHQILNAKNNEHEADIIAEAGARGAVTLATNIAGRGTDIVLGDGVDKLGGLHVLGTERHESRRIDNQLRGRSGRQGDPGSSQFFVSLEDDLMRIFGSERIAGLMNTLKVPEDMPIENSMITRSLEAAQKKVEGHNFDIRKHLVEYDDVMNSHREIIYARRRKVIGNDTLKAEIKDMVEAEFEAIIAGYTDQKTGEVNLEKIAEAANNIIPVPPDWAKKTDSKLSADLVKSLKAISDATYDEREAQFGAEGVRMMERLVCLKVIDSAWLAHLETMDHLRAGIGLRGYGQRDPLVEYKAEAFTIFKRLERSINAEIASTIFKVAINFEQAPPPIETDITKGAQTAITSGASEGPAQADTTDTTVRSRGRDRGPAKVIRTTKKTKKSKKKRRR